MKVGDVVQLKSGGVPMTVAKIDHTGVFCMWMDGTTRHEGTFAADTLKINPPSDGPLERDSSL